MISIYYQYSIWNNDNNDDDNEINNTEYNIYDIYRFLKDVIIWIRNMH